ncbi:sugar ABC transporter permease [Cohnella sp. CIP 111063]|uniref:carbohydrate ABC transporter permease n=1 Tax=unclassified Cohnella TaxID=2636738 RepID=UPI000B8BE5A8|nr:MULTISPECIES: sugar ABC transporter permease [unclassified Cohnella]OXS54752.1 sugar ABC transporter permease [Cohnella sp. CIP 111063]PRX64589.1 carbohydrate ABC transporter membrane protein 1 (CUT1 family) [Cohnella sp. SGD-V74]
MNIHWRKKEIAAAFMFLMPSAGGFALFYVIPFAMGLVYSFQDGTPDGAFVGLAGYRELLASASFRKAAWNTALFTFMSVPLMIGSSLCLAILLNKSVYLRKWLRTAFILPLVVPVASVVFIWQIGFDWNGAVNAWMHSFGMERIDWMKSDWAIVTVTLVYAWKNMGYNVILFLAGLQNIPESYYEIARLEGAGPFTSWRSITMVYLMPTLFFVVLMSIIGSFKVFRETYLIAGNYPHDSIYMLQHYMNNMFLSLDIQKLTAAASLMVGSIMILVAGLYLLERRFRTFME